MVLKGDQNGRAQIHFAGSHGARSQHCSSIKTFRWRNVTVGRPSNNSTCEGFNEASITGWRGLFLDGCNLERTAVLTVSDDIMGEGVCRLCVLRIPDTKCLAEESVSPVRDGVPINLPVRSVESPESNRLICP